MFFISVLSGKTRTKAAGYFFEVEYVAALKGLPHSRHLAFNPDVINPQDGHILCE
jgi:hypothetical protein